MNVPYTYLIGWSQLDKWYYGVRYAKNCHPSDLWNPYKTSSKHVLSFIAENGEPDIIRVSRIFNSRKEACDHEFKFLKRVSAIKNEKFLNKGMPASYGAVHDGMLGKTHSEQTKKLMSIRNAERIKSGWKPKAWTEEQKQKVSLRMKGVPKSDEHKAKLKFSCLIGVEAARKTNLGKKKPKHSLYMKEINDQRAPRYPTPIGDFRKCHSPYAVDLLCTWCKYPDVIISKMSITKSKKKNVDLVSYDWVGKTRREVGFSEPYLLSD